mmetsp:Transcript_31374/g.65494  ORF Transcript_31374/g.65494 Transcript_31374/m.65494 type:complete len:644 (-) Transcript_31374:3643-5574(-)
MSSRTSWRPLLWGFVGLTLMIPLTMVVMTSMSASTSGTILTSDVLAAAAAAAAVSSASLSSLSASVQDTAQQGIHAVEELVVSSTGVGGSGTRSDSHSENETIPPSGSVENRNRIEYILNTNQTSWGAYAKMMSVNGTVLKNYTGQESVDMTRNVPRIEDFATSQPEAKPRVLLDTDEDDSTRQEAPPDQQEPLNIVLFYADDWTMKVLGKLNPHVDTPNIDAMADRGMIFTRNCVTTSICWISRNTLATGVYAAVHKNVKIAQDLMFNKTVSWLETLYPMLKKNGYYTGLVGKWHAPMPGVFRKNTFDRFQSYYGAHWMTRDNKRRHVTDLNGQDAIDFLRTRPKEKKFSLTVSFFATHAVDGNQKAPYQPMNESMSLYTNVTVPRPKTATENHWNELPWFFNQRNEGRKRWKTRFDTDENYQEKIKNLYRMASEVDAVVGAVIDELKQQGVYEKTILIFTTDNGNLHGEHGLAEKWYPWEESIRVPLVIQDPRMPQSAHGTRNDDFTLSVDLAPTILSAAQVQPPKFMQGRDIAQLYLQPEKAKKTWRQDFFYEWTQGEPRTAVGHNAWYHIPAVFALIRKDYKYFYWPQTKYEQLFRVETDPYEENDILNSTAQTTQQALQIMKARYAFLKDWAQSGNPV